MSLPPRAAMANRFELSGKSLMTLIVVSDWDPEGVDLTNAAGQSLRDEFGIEDLRVVRAALKPEQAEEFGLPRDFEAKLTSSRCKGFVDTYGRSVWELEALEPDVLQAELDSAIRSVIDVTLFNKELEQEEKDQKELGHTRLRIVGTLGQDPNFAEDDYDDDDDDDDDDFPPSAA